MLKKKYGIWGFGVVGKSVFKYLHAKGYQLSVMDQRPLSEGDRLFLEAHESVFISQDERHRFFEDNDYLVISPGVPRTNDIPAHKVVEELDLFCDAWKKKLIALTGSLGKTSTIQLLSQVMAHCSYPTALGGNIGTGMLDLLALEPLSEYGLLELSSFQLEQSVRCRPDLAVWLNFYPNHLDRHQTFERYFLAKYQIMRYQSPTQKALVPFSLKDLLREQTDRSLHFFSTHSFSDRELSVIESADIFYGKRDSEVIKITADTEEVLNPFTIPGVSFEDNWLAIRAIADMLQLRADRPISSFEVKLPEHRLEKVATIKGVTFYNDSKSSIFEATEAAVESLQPQRIHLLLGGISKGVDRTALIPRLKGKVVSIHCFGREASELYQAAIKAAIPASSYASLDEACRESFIQASPQDIVLLSPAGASYDLFSNYKERGDSFKSLVRTGLFVS